MTVPSRFNKIRGPGNSSRVQDSLDNTLTPVAKSLINTPIMGSPAPAWQKPDLLSDWTNLGGEFAVAGYHKDVLGYVHMKGAITTAAGRLARVAIFVLPMGYRPLQTNIFAVEGNGITANFLVIEGNGTVSSDIAIPAGQYIFLTCTFLAEQ